MTASSASPFCEVADVRGVTSRACTTLPGGSGPPIEEAIRGVIISVPKSKGALSSAEVNRPHGNVLRMNRQLCFDISFQPMHAARGPELLHRFVPLLLGLFFGLSGSLGSRILDAFPLLALRSRDEPDHLARTGTYARLQLEMPSVWQRQVVETHFQLPFRSKVCIQRSDRALAPGDRLDLGNLAGYLRPHGDDKAVKRIYRFYDECMNRLTYSFYTDLLIQSYLQRCAPGH
jgi:hypothetical protein